MHFLSRHFILVPYLIISLGFGVYFYRLFKKSNLNVARASDLPLISIAALTWPMHIFGLIYLKITGKLID